jgi:hypothetical protein
VITWLFTQVWLWSLAAFALGALITWLLFVRPLRRRLTEAAAYPERDYEYDPPSGYDEQAADEAPLDLLRPAPQRWEPADGPAAGDWGQAPRAWVPPEQAQPARADANRTWFREWDARVNGSPRDDDDVAVTAVQPRVPPAEQQQPVKPAAPESSSAKPPAAEPQSAVGSSGTGASGPAGSRTTGTKGSAASQGAAQPHAAGAQSPVGSQGAVESRAVGANGPAESTAAESSAAGTSAVQPPAVESQTQQAGSSTPAEPKATSGGDQQTEFAVAMWPAAEPETTESSDAPARTPQQVVAAIVAEAAAESAAAAAAETAASAAEPAKTEPAKPEAQQAKTAERDDAGRLAGRLEGADDATESRLSGQLRSLFEEAEPQGATGAAKTPYVPPAGADATQVIPKVEDGKAEPPPLPRRTPGAGPRPGKEGGSGPMIKGHSASRQYHSPESPAYDKIVADVWFRTAADAEIAGFQPWNGRRAT